MRRREGQRGLVRFVAAAAPGDGIGVHLLLASETATFFDLLEDHFDMAIGYLSLQAANLLDLLGRERESESPSTSLEGQVLASRPRQE